MSEKKHCLNDELFNLALDGEYEFNDAEHAHLESCEACRQRYTELRRLHLLLSENWEIPLDEFSTAAIKFNVHRKLAETKRRSVFRHIRPLGIAAGTLVVAGATLLLSDFFNATQKTQFAADNPTVAVLNEAEDYPYYSTKPAIMNNRNALSRRLAVNQLGTLPIDQLIPVGAGRTNTVLVYLKELLANNQDSLAVIDSNVSHVWAAANTERADDDLAKLLDMLKLKDKFHLNADNGNGVIRLSADLTKGQLLQFVRAARWYDWDLLSSQQPQPESTILLSAEDEPVHYEMTIVESF
ncbi:MAG: hypothetical protein PHI85_06190 [Victivallaceae bacterium]|nr:hypothetical protein [Victivallaceae bacterium]